MKQALILKNLGGEVSAAQLEAINRFSRRALEADEVYVFSLLLCDNAVDRDGERFSSAALQKLASLFVGKTGIFNHDPKGQNQTARIFETAVETDDGRVVENGEPYRALRAWAYMVRCPKNEDLILEIDAGIKKEVSVGCAVGKVLCSVCGADLRDQPCGHRPGEVYNGVLCWRELEEPTDAYEWSFVAVPAQPNAGVTKQFSAAEPGQLRKALESGQEVLLDPAQAAALADQLRSLESLAEDGRARLDRLRRKMVALAAFALPSVPAGTVGEVAKGMDAGQLEAFCRGLSSMQGTPPSLQLGGTSKPAPDNQAFCI